MNKGFEDLKVWQLAIQLAKLIYQETKSFPVDERYGLTSQIRRCAVSVASNIAEGCSHNSANDFLRFLAIARGSLSELKTQIIIAFEVDYLNEIQKQQLLSKTDEVAKLLNALRRSLKTEELTTRIPATNN